MEITWSPRAIEKLEQIADYIALDAPERAKSFLSELVASVERLKEFPLSGPIARENPAFRQIVFQKYRLIYRVLENRVEIVAVVAPREQTN